MLIRKNVKKRADRVINDIYIKISKKSMNTQSPPFATKKDLSRDTKQQDARKDTYHTGKNIIYDSNAQ